MTLIMANIAVSAGGLIIWILSGGEGVSGFCLWMSGFNAAMAASSIAMGLHRRSAA